MVDMDAVAQSLWSKNNDVQIANMIGKQVGMMTSAWEHRIPEMLFTNEEHPGEAVSAVKALAIASAEGQRIYQVTQENVNAVQPVLNISSEVKDEIRASVAVGKVATVSQNNITVGSWTGVGYIIADPETGAGAYRISGGSNGAQVIISAVGMTALTILSFIQLVNPFVFVLLFFTTMLLIHLAAEVELSTLDSADWSRIWTYTGFYTLLLLAAAPVAIPIVLGLIFLIVADYYGSQ
ncbi:MAG: hypothetical protein DRR00_28450 [Candidatus Parabeggiatoa sp. nov. 3]|nr:MAG: hypothetical protein DRR00_28450 [Gammaproteobacteria bacterium]RKZ56465.1 MAG: hypothetical protein DRQ99_28450 [Gammaproteobacteria bacterium]